MFLASFLHRFVIHFGSQIPPKMLPKTYLKNHENLNRFYIDFGSILGSNLDPIFFKNDSKWGEGVKGVHVFYHLRFLSPFWGTPWPRFDGFGVDFSSILGRSGLRFGRISAPTEQQQRQQQRQRQQQNNAKIKQ